MLMEELNVIDAPADDFTVGVIAGVGIGVTLVGLALTVGLLTC